MIVRALSGHLASGRWRLKQENGLYFLSHIQPFSRRGEFRIGPDQIENVTVESEKKDDVIIRIDFTEDRYCRAQMKKNDVPFLKKMVSDMRPAPLAKSQQANWIIGLSIFFLICIIFEIVK